jgi:hypothetical protein
MFAERIRKLLRLALSAARKPQRLSWRCPRWRPSLEGLESRLAPATGDFGFALDLGGSGAFASAISSGPSSSAGAAATSAMASR